MTNLVEFKDTRTDVIGAAFTIDGEKFDALCAKAALSPLTQVRVTLIDAVEDAPPHGGIRKCDDPEADVPFDLTNDEWEVTIPVSDRIEFSEKAVARVNRNLLHTLRHIAQERNFIGFFGAEEEELELTAAVSFFAGPVLERDAYLVERSIKESPEANCLLPEQVTLAEDPVVEDVK